MIVMGLGGQDSPPLRKGRGRDGVCLGIGSFPLVNFAAMAVKDQTAKKDLHQQPSTSVGWKSWQPYVFILLGLIVVPLAIWNIIATEQKFNSPFDQIDAESANQQGFLPMLQIEPGEQIAIRDSGESQDTAPELEPEPSIQGSAAPTLETFPAVAYAQLPDLEANPGLMPEHLLIPAIDLYVPVVSAENRYIDFEGRTYKQWEAPRGYVAGWQTDSAGLGVPGNTVLYGHHNIAGKVFEDLYRLEVGQVIQMKSGEELFTYRIAATMILEEKFQPLEVRLDNARWILPSYDERITLITCWPQRGNTHRVVVVAVRDEPEGQSSLIPVTGSQPTPTAAPATAVAMAQATPTSNSLQWAPPVEGSPYDPNAAPPDLSTNPGLEPTRILIPIVDIGYPEVPIEKQLVRIDGISYNHWEGPHVVAAGWESSSAGLGVPGNTVLFGWQDVYGGPFRDLHKVLVGQVVQLKSGDELFNYRVAHTVLLSEICQDMLPDSAGERWTLPSTDERVTLITCYPEFGYSHRVVVVALREE